MNKMLRQLRIRATSSLLRPAIPRRQFGSRPPLKSYTPGPYFYPPPKSRGSRLKDMAIGSALTIATYIAWLAYEYRQYSKEIEEVEDKIQQDRDLFAELSQNFHEARRASDQARLKELTFEFTRVISKGWAEVGPLSRFPESDEFYGKDNIPEEDTLIFINNVDAIEHSLLVNIAINADFEEIFPLAARTSGSIALRDSIFFELILRLKYHAAEWVREGFLAEDDELNVNLILRDKYFGLSFPLGALPNKNNSI